MSVTKENNDVENVVLHPYIEYLNKLSGRELKRTPNLYDHCYSKPWNVIPDATHVKPAIMLFMDNIKKYNSTEIVRDDEEIDVSSLQEDGPLYSFDENVQPNNDDKNWEIAKALRPDSNLDEFEEKPSKNWSPVKSRLYNKTIKALQADRLSRLTSKGSPNEIIDCKLNIERTAQQIRAIFGSTFWDMELLTWLHQTLVENMNPLFLGPYVNALLHLKTQSPLIDKLLSHCKGHPASLEQLDPSFKSPWDPVGQLINQAKKTSRLPGSPLILLIPPSPQHPLMASDQRYKYFQNNIGAWGKLIPITVPSTGTVEFYLDTLLSSIKLKIADVRSSYPNRPIILIGWHVGGLIASHIALIEEVSCVVSLGFLLTGINGSRGDLDDSLLDSKTPTLFVIGQNASTCTIDNMEDYRCRMKAESGLIIVGGGDDMLRVLRMKQRLEHITQQMVDQCILNEIESYLKDLLSRDPVSCPSPPPNNSSLNGKRVGDSNIKRRYRKKYADSSYSAYSSQLAVPSTSTSYNNNAHHSSSFSRLGYKKVGRRPGRPPNPSKYFKLSTKPSSPKAPQTRSLPINTTSLSTLLSPDISLLPGPDMLPILSPSKTSSPKREQPPDLINEFPIEAISCPETNIIPPIPMQTDNDYDPNPTSSFPENLNLNISASESQLNLSQTSMDLLIPDEVEQSALLSQIITNSSSALPFPLNSNLLPDDFLPKDCSEASLSLLKEPPQHSGLNYPVEMNGSQINYDKNESELSSLDLSSFMEVSAIDDELASSSTATATSSE